MIKASVAQHIGTVITKSNPSALQANGLTPLTHVVLSRDKLNLLLGSLVLNDLDVDILVGSPSMTLNDISVGPAKQQVMIGDSNTINYGTSDLDNHNLAGHAHAYVLKPETTSVI